MAVVLAEPHHYNPSSLSPDPNYIWIPSPSEHVPTHHTSYEIPGVNLPHLSPGSTYQVNNYTNMHVCQYIVYSQANSFNLH